ncbi:hypothetical protein [Promicromonospora sp. NPDC050249]|uniref:DprA-like winged helix domain-containing protein n=1 Tax=Promicromonospora sp. NPDC050249 TaxID=3154743 RepID=UPI0033E24650
MEFAERSTGRSALPQPLPVSSQPPRRRDHAKGVVVIVDPIALRVIVRDLLRVEEDYRSAFPGAPVRTDGGRRSRSRRSRSVSNTRGMPPTQANRVEDAILRVLSNGPQSAAALARSTGMSFAGVLIELEALETAGVVARTARGVVQLNTSRPAPSAEAGTGPSCLLTGDGLGALSGEPFDSAGPPDSP